MGQAQQKRGAVLIVEDDAELRSLTAALLEDDQLDTIECESAEAALAVMLIGGQHVALIFADIRLCGVMDGIDLAHELRRPAARRKRNRSTLFTRDKPVIFAFHGYPRIIHWLTYRRHNHDNFHVRGYKEEGTTTTPFDMDVLNNLDRYQLALDAVSWIPRLREQRQTATDRYWSTMERHKLYVSEHGEDMPEVQNWRWTSAA